jgi:microcystin-dependent protein
MPILWPRSRTQVFNPAAANVHIGTRAFLFNAQTLTPRIGFQDAGLTIPHANPIVADANGIFPRVYLDFGDYRERVTTSGGVVLWDDDNIANPAPVTSGGGSTVDPTTLVQTGDIFSRFMSGARPGYVRLNGLGIGSAASGGVERASADTSALFQLLWNFLPDSVAPVVGGRGSSAVADYAANKQILLPDTRGRVLSGVDGMGNVVAGRYAGGVLNAGQDALGTTGGAAAHTLTIAELANHDHGGVTGQGGAHLHTFTSYTSVIGSPGGVLNAPDNASATNANTSSAPNHQHSIPAQGGGGSHNNLQPLILVTNYIKL